MFIENQEFLSDIGKHETHVFAEPDADTVDWYLDIRTFDACEKRRDDLLVQLRVLHTIYGDPHKGECQNAKSAALAEIAQVESAIIHTENEMHEKELRILEHDPHQKAEMIALLEFVIKLENAGRPVSKNRLADIHRTCEQTLSQPQLAA